MLPLHSERLVLRRFVPGDIAIFVAYRNDPGIARYQGWESCSVEEATALVESQRDREPGTPDEWFQIAIALRDTDSLIGDCGLKVQSSDARQATIGITIAPEYQGRGFAAEGLSRLFDYLFLEADLHRVVADTDPENVPAWRLLERLGMRREGHFRESLWFKGRWADEYLYAILSSDWLTNRRRS